MDTYHEYQTNHIKYHFNAQSVTTRISWKSTLALNYALKHSKIWADLAILETIQAGAMWPIRSIATTLQEQNICPMCKQDVDKWQTFWTCPCLATSEEEDVMKPQHRIR